MFNIKLEIVFHHCQPAVTQHFETGIEKYDSFHIINILTLTLKLTV